MARVMGQYQCNPLYEVVEGPLQRIGVIPLGALSSLWSQAIQLRTRENQAPSQLLKEMIRLIDSLHKEFESVSSTVSILSLGLDPHRFARFRSVTPAILKTIGGRHTTV